jgi:RNA polymerase II-associated factor 1
MHNQPTAFHFVRDYETVKIEQEVPNEFLLVLDDGDTKPFGASSKPRGKGAYYKNIERKMILKKKRVNVRLCRSCFLFCHLTHACLLQINEAYPNKWEVVNITHVEMAKDEQEEREEAMAEVLDPMYMHEVDADGEGEGEGEVDEKDNMAMDVEGAQTDAVDVLAT